LGWNWPVPVALGSDFSAKGGSVLYPKHPSLRTASLEELFFKSHFPIQLMLGTTFFGVPIQLGMRSPNSCFTMKLFFFSAPYYFAEDPPGASPPALRYINRCHVPNKAEAKDSKDVKKGGLEGGP